MANRTRIFILAFTVFLFIFLQIFVYTTYKGQLNSALANVKEDLSSHSVTLSSVIDERFALLRGIDAFIRTVGFDAEEEDILQFIEKVHTHSPGIKSVIIAPNGVIQYVFPIEGNEPILGSDYTSNVNLATPEILELTLSSRTITLDGPRELVQGGIGIIARQAIYDGEQFTGIIAISIDFEELIRRASLDSTIEKYDSFVISNREGKILYGNYYEPSDDRISIPVSLQNEQWTFSAALPKKVRNQILFFAVVMEMAGLAVIALQFHAFRRQFLFNAKLERLVNQRTAALRNANEDLLAVEEELRYQNELLENRTIELEISERKYEQLAYQDALTLISNRWHFIEEMQQMLSIKRGSQQKLALFFFDINQFNLVNDTFGHTVGDELLVAMANRISNSALGYKLFARLGGDEFVIVCDRISNTDDAKVIADQIIALFTESFQIRKLNIHTSVRIGIALYPDHGNTLEELMKHADLAMYHAKKHSDLHYRFFDSAMMEQLLQKRDFPTMFQNALDNKEIILHYQPQIDIATSRIVGLEALARWQHPERGLLYPNDFIPLAEETGLVTALTDYVIEEVCKQSQEWKKKGLPTIRISLNLSSAWFFKKDVEEEFFATLKRYDVSPKDIELEITENIALMDECYPVLETLLQAGVTVAIDDFGLAYSSLSYLKRFPINKIKIDKGFIHGIGLNHIDETIVQAISFITKRLNYEVIAEGVESMEQANFLHKHGCSSAQGYLYYRPIPVDQVEQLLAENSK